MIRGHRWRWVGGVVACLALLVCEVVFARAGGGGGYSGGGGGRGGSSGGGGGGDLIGLLIMLVFRYPLIGVPLLICVGFGFYWTSKNGRSAHVSRTIRRGSGVMEAQSVAAAVSAIGKRDPIWIIRGGIAIAMISVMMAWASWSFEFSMVAFFLAGLGLATLFPIAAALTMATVPLQATAASARLVLATGLAILVAPFLLGVIADTSGVTVAWLLIPALFVAALALTVPVSRGRVAESRASSAV